MSTRTIQITDAMRAEIGVETEPWLYEITAPGIRAFARGVGYEDLTYFDVEAARAEGYEALPAPPCYTGTPVYLPGRSDPVFSGPPGTGPRPRFGLEHVLDASTDITYVRPLFAGDLLTVRHRLVDLELKHSKSLGTMLLASSEAVFCDGSGAVVMRERTGYMFY